MFKKREFLAFFQYRTTIVLFILMGLGALILIIMTLLNIRVSDVQIPVRYSGYGFTNLYRDKWYALLSFVIFPLLIICINGFLAIKLFENRRELSIGLLAISLFIITLAIIVSNAVFRLAALSL
jgi:hypothetical protein